MTSQVMRVIPELKKKIDDIRDQFKRDVGVVLTPGQAQKILNKLMETQNLNITLTHNYKVRKIRVSKE